MVSNYVKKGLIPSPVKKLYCADQIAYLFFIVIAKQVLSMENIITLSARQKQTYTIPVAYNYFCEELENMLQYTFGLKKQIDAVGTPEDQSETKNMLRSTIIAVTHIIYLSNRFENMKAPEEAAQEADRMALPNAEK